MTDADRVRAVYDFVVTSTRYVGLEFGIHGFKPYKVTQVLARRFGDCKDKAALLIALLREVGVSAELVLVRTRRGGRLDTSRRRSRSSITRSSTSPSWIATWTAPRSSQGWPSCRRRIRG